MSLYWYYLDKKCELEIKINEIRTNKRLKKIKEKEEKSQKEKRAREEEDKRRSQYLKKLRMDYLQLPQFWEDNVVGMRKVEVVKDPFYEGTNDNSVFAMELMTYDENLRRAESIYFVEEKSNVTDEFVQMIPDSLDDVIEALALVIPVLNGTKIARKLGGMKMCPVNVSDDYKFISEDVFDKIGEIEYSVLQNVYNTWSNYNLLTSVGGVNYDKWNAVFSNMAYKFKNSKFSDTGKGKTTSSRKKDNFDKIYENLNNYFSDDQIKLRHQKEEQAKSEKEKQSQEAIKAAGRKGEEKVNYALQFLSKDFIRIEPKSLNDLGDSCIMLKNEKYLPLSQEYDHIVIGRQGIFLIETKNYSGIITIDEKQDWIRNKQEKTLSDEAEKGIRSPLQQLIQHEKVVRSFINNEVPIISIICIANEEAIIKGRENFKYPVMKSEQLVSFIEEYNNDICLNNSEMDYCAKEIYLHMI